MSEIMTSPFLALKSLFYNAFIRLKVTDGVANNVGPDQTAQGLICFIRLILSNILRYVLNESFIIIFVC